MSAFPLCPIPAANVASVPQRSPLRYPGGKTYLIPHLRFWLGSLPAVPEVFMEPFCGGGTASLTAVAERLAHRAIMRDSDPDVAAFWKAALYHGPELRNLVAGFQATEENVQRVTSTERTGDDVIDGFRTLVLNRTRRGGVLAPGAGMMRSGESGKGVASRWYPSTLYKRLAAVEEHADNIVFSAGDGMLMLRDAGKNVEQTAVFVDPPYTAGGKKAGHRLYRHSDLDHSRVFELLAEHTAPFLMTYDCSDVVAGLIEKFDFAAVSVKSRNSHNRDIGEWIITRQPVFTGGVLF